MSDNLFLAILIAAFVGLTALVVAYGIDLNEKTKACKQEGGVYLVRERMCVDLRVIDLRKDHDN